jgi:hypothetical protein
MGELGSEGAAVDEFEIPGPGSRGRASFGGRSCASRGGGVTPRRGPGTAAQPRWSAGLRALRSPRLAGFLAITAVAASPGAGTGTGAGTGGVSVICPLRLGRLLAKPLGGAVGAQAASASANSGGSAAAGQQASDRYNGRGFTEDDLTAPCAQVRDARPPGHWRVAISRLCLPLRTVGQDMHGLVAVRAVEVEAGTKSTPSASRSTGHGRVTSNRLGAHGGSQRSPRANESTAPNISGSELAGRRANEGPELPRPERDSDALHPYPVVWLFHVDTPYLSGTRLQPTRKSSSGSS